LDVGTDASGAPTGTAAGTEEAGQEDGEGGRGLRSFDFALDNFDVAFGDLSL